MLKEQSKSDPKPRRGGAKAAEAARVAAIFERFEAAEPHPKGELIHTNLYTLLVAVVLSAQATDVGVNKATAALFAVADTPAKMVALGEERLLDYIKTIGLFRAKAKNVIALSKLLLAPLGDIGSGLQEYLASNLYIPVESFTLDTILDLAKVPELKAADLQQRYFFTLGAALRVEEKAL